MRFGLLFLFACAGPGQQRLADSPTARTPATPMEAPPASVDDRDRDEVVKSFDAQKDAKEVRAETRKKPAPPPAELQPTPEPASPK